MSRQHRWTRGDIQILGWLRKKIRNKNGVKVNNPLNGVEKFKIFDNLPSIEERIELIDKVNKEDVINCVKKTTSSKKPVFLLLKTNINNLFHY